MRDWIMRNLGHIPVEPIDDRFARHLLNLFPKVNTTQWRDIYPDNSELPSGIPGEIKVRIAQMCLFRKSAEMTIGDRIVRVHMRMPYKYSGKFDKYISRISLWLSVAMKQASHHCGEPLEIFLYFSDHLKRMPHINEPIDSINANTAYASICGKICVYRHEEWFKVLIHETYHNLGLDFCNMNCDKANRRLNTFFKLPGFDLKLYEAYCETWAVLMHSALTAFETTRDKTNTTLMISKFKKELDYNVRFSLYQRMKVLRHLNALREKRENTASFSYYVIKASLAYRANSFLEWCASHNEPMMDFRKTPANVADFCDLVERLAAEMPKLPKTREPAYMRETLRMVGAT